MEIKLNVQQRIVLLNLLPATGDFGTLKQIRVLREELAFDDKENKALGLKTDPQGAIRWNPDHKVKDKGIEFGEIMHGVIVELLKEKSDAKELHESQVDLYEIFVVDGYKAPAKTKK